MKSNYVNANSLKTVLRNGFFAVSLVLVSAIGAHAQVVQAAYKTPVASLAPVVTYLGSADEAMSFNMKYENAAGDKCLVSVLDSNGEVLFDQVFTDKKFNKTFQVPSDMGKLSFVVRNIKTRTLKRVEVSTERHFVEEISVTKLY
ncbi:MAG TPA: hypothetical protein VLD19_09290 [Chitinophagaceae bacterium]|nr:hypothetical protein [Chitinophagaceae bacterium]